MRSNTEKSVGSEQTRLALGGAVEQLTQQIDRHSVLPTEPIKADPYVVSSLMQKAIRRGEREIAQRAALTLFGMRGSAIWRRFMVIAFEDVGVGNIDVVTMVVAAGSDAGFRRSCGGDVRVAAHLAGMMADAPKDRSADYLCGAKDHPALASFAQRMAVSSLAVRLFSMRDRTLGWPQRAVAASSVLSIGPRGEISGGAKSVDVLLASFRELGVPEALVAATAIAAVRTRESITVMVPLIWLAARESQRAVVRECAVPPLQTACGVPVYALDEHTRLGREAIWRFACESDEVWACLEGFVPASRRRRAANVTAFYVDAAPVARRLVWDQSEALEVFGIDRDFLHAGVPAEGISPLLDAMRANLGHLNALRADILTRVQAVPGASARHRGGVR